MIPKMYRLAASLAKEYCVLLEILWQTAKEFGPSEHLCFVVEEKRWLKTVCEIFKQVKGSSIFEQLHFPDLISQQCGFSVNEPEIIRNFFNEQGCGYRGGHQIVRI